MLEGKVAIVTGGTKGIGFSTVKKFLNNKAKVVLFGSREETVSKALEELKQINPNYEVMGLYPKLTDEEEVKKCFENINNIYGHIDILVNNAGMSSHTKIEDFTESEYDKISDLNIKSVFMCSKLIVPYLKESKF